MLLGPKPRHVMVVGHRQIGSSAGSRSPCESSLVASVVSNDRGYAVKP